MSQAAIELVIASRRVSRVNLAAMLILAIRCPSRSAPYLIQISTPALANDLRLSERQARRVLDTLIRSRLILQDVAQSGRTPAVYRLIP